MSDLHTITGIALLISGFAQLRCDISACDWQMLVYIAWFSCVTNFACITFLRQYLYQHPRERAWRLLCTGILVTLLVVAYIPTVNQSWAHDDPTNPEIEEEFGMEPSGAHSHSWTPGYSRQAICLFREPITRFLYDKLSVAFSIMFLVGAFAIRLVSLHRYLVRDVFGKLRAHCSSYVQLQLLRVWRMSEGNMWHNRLARRLFYHPFLVSSL